ncbi:spinster family MFS transporter [Erythrobacter aureus]|jgi:predicted MFS family arabinose efflux permease|uniref:MFS transporter n=1 Tax=Erythrobacter aureus TaxID=2182384 RepID=A0A345YF52_9SPHN|nr:MFS transporter [Erythrobacter aureus]AXK42554.1 MFS transporter [Erythrobacter aureus]MBQ95036.1 MFS transporter [Actinomycetota bacterium]|tara:strand:- start:1195 stop:2481 length:1287 start_codon:yes stop_codon:yes gene_type:complete
MATAAARQTGGSVRVTLWILLIVYIFNFIDRQIVNILAEPIRLELGLSDTQIGLMTGLAFALFYTILGLPIARFSDRPTTHRPKLIAAALATWSAMTALCGMAQNFVQLLLARIGVGIGEAGCTPPAHSLIADMVEPKKRSSALAFYALGIPVGTLLGMMIGGLLADFVGWRRAFFIVGVPGVLLAIVVAWVLKEPRRHLTQAQAASNAQQTMPLGQAVRSVMGSKAFVLLLVAGSAAAFLAYGKTTWTTIFFQRTHGLTPGEVGFWFGVVNGAAGIAGTFLGGWLADRYGAENRRHVLTAPAVGMALAVPLAFLAYRADNWLFALTLLFLPTLFNSLYYGPTYSAAQGLVPLRARAIAAAVLLFFQNLIGLGLGPLFFGMLSDWLRPEFGEESVRYVLYGAAFLGLLPAFFFWRCSLRLNEELDQKD